MNTSKATLIANSLTCLPHNILINSLKLKNSSIQSRNETLIGIAQPLLSIVEDKTDNLYLA